MDKTAFSVATLSDESDEKSYWVPKNLKNACKLSSQCGRLSRADYDCVYGKIKAPLFWERGHPCPHERPLGREPFELAAQAGGQGCPRSQVWSGRPLIGNPLYGYDPFSSRLQRVLTVVELTQS
jgi:hypothetical protein